MEKKEMTEKALEILDRLDELRIILRDKAVMALLAIHNVDHADGKDEEEKRNVRDGAYCVLWSTVPEMPKILEELEVGIMRVKSELQSSGGAA